MRTTLAALAIAAISGASLAASPNDTFQLSVPFGKAEGTLTLSHETTFDLSTLGISTLEGDVAAQVIVLDEQGAGFVAARAFPSGVIHTRSLNSDGTVTNEGRKTLPSGSYRFVAFSESELLVSGRSNRTGMRLNFAGSPNVKNQGIERGAISRYGGWGGRHVDSGTLTIVSAFVASVDGSDINAGACVYSRRPDIEWTAYMEGCPDDAEPTTSPNVTVTGGGANVEVFAVVRDASYAIGIHGSPSDLGPQAMNWDYDALTVL